MTGKVVMPFDTRPYTADITKLASHMNDRILRNRLCEEGPDHCPECLLCEFGKEYLIREKRKEAVPCT